MKYTAQTAAELVAAIKLNDPGYLEDVLEALAEELDPRTMNEGTSVDVNKVSSVTAQMLLDHTGADAILCSTVADWLLAKVMLYFATLAVNGD